MRLPCVVFRFALGANAGSSAPNATAIRSAPLRPAALILTTGSSLHRHLITSAKRFGARKTSFTTKFERPMDRRSLPLSKTAIGWLDIPWRNEKKFLATGVMRVRVRPAALLAENPARTLPRCGTFQTAATASSRQCDPRAYLLLRRRAARWEAAQAARSPQRSRQDNSW